MAVEQSVDGAPQPGGVGDAAVASAIAAALGADAGAEFDQITFTLADPAEAGVDDGSADATDAELDRFIRATNSFSGHEHVSALSAFGQNMAKFRPLPTAAEQGPRLAAYRAGVLASRKLATGK